ncbi:prephenate dehydratase [Fibrobacter sp. UWEL]|uniref:prephenate dehydratase n=1 Tax=Fibrobacter sp. UWEL TaxID=1896209 RepID=UPI0009249F5F|nr:prephenate dehydratase [Fibrobacter sp. UWEL]SHL09548.1 prephenate dehydratase [Fibrobacter sp. UWEL]
MKKIAFQGRKGAYSDCAAHYLFGEDIETLPMDTFEEIYQAIENGEADGGAIPIENSTAGSIEANYDLLYKWRHRIVGEVMLRIEHTLCVMPGVKVEDLKRVYSHPQALAQCSKFFAENPQIKAVPAFDTAGSAEELAARGNRDEGAIASAYAAKIYNLDILKAGLENLRGTNFTRFYAIQKTPADFAETEGAKTTLLLELAHSDSVGALYNVLGCFAKRGINLTRCESRPHPDKPWEYIFHISFEANVSDPRAKEALAELKNYTSFVYILGTFKKGVVETLKY